MVDSLQFVGSLSWEWSCPAGDWGPPIARPGGPEIWVPIWLPCRWRVFGVRVPMHQLGATPTLNESRFPVPELSFTVRFYG